MWKIQDKALSLLLKLYHSMTLLRGVTLWLPSKFYGSNRFKISHKTFYLFSFSTILTVSWTWALQRSRTLKSDKHYFPKLMNLKLVTPRPPVVLSWAGSPGLVWSPWVCRRTPGGPSCAGGCPASAWWWSPPARARSSWPAGGRRWGRGCASSWSWTAARRWYPGNLHRQL